MKRIVQATVLCWRSLREQRRDPWPLGVFCVLIVMLGDDAARWLARKAGAPPAEWLATWPAWGVTLAFGVGPALLLAAWVLGPEWLACWRRTR